MKENHLPEQTSLSQGVTMILKKLREEVTGYHIIDLYLLQPADKIRLLLRGFMLGIDAL
jgi:hypothetical protein